MNIDVIRKRFSGEYKHMVFVSMLITSAIVLHTVETFFVSPILWFRVGFANIVTLISIMVLGLKETLIIVVVRVLMGSLITGTLLAPSFFFSISGGIVSAAGMWLIYRFGWRFFGIVGISVFGALLHNVTQLFVGYILFIRTEALFMLLPVLIVTAVISGSLNGLLAGMVMKQMELY